MGRNFAETLFILLLVGAILLVFYDVNTSMVEQGIAKGDAYQNAAAYPIVLSIILILCISLVIFRNLIFRNIEKTNLIFDLKHIQLFIIFCIYLIFLDMIGYHLLTPILLFITSFIYGERNWFITIIYSIIISLLIALIFEELLNVVLPVGVFEIALPVLL
mgnify:CR=1 FL=1